MERIQEKSLEMAKYFVDFCETHQLLCYLCGGGAIGALRHQGFIPWDDDLDFFMPRKDYERLILLWPKKADARYRLSNSNRHYVDRNLFVTIRDEQTTCVKGYQQDQLEVPHGLALDVIPIDYCPRSSKAHKRQKLLAYIYSLFRAQTAPKKHGGLMALGSRLLLTICFSKQLRYAIWKRAEKRMTRYRKEEAGSIIELCSGPHYMQNNYPLEAFESALWLEFEDTKMPVPVGYDIYLRTAFGDYMQLPPEEKRVPPHDNVFLDLDTPYITYKGIEYGRK